MNPKSKKAAKEPPDLPPLERATQAMQENPLSSAARMPYGMFYDFCRITTYLQEALNGAYRTGIVAARREVNPNADAESK